MKERKMHGIITTLDGTSGVEVAGAANGANLMSRRLCCLSNGGDVRAMELVLMNGKAVTYFPKKSTMTIIALDETGECIDVMRCPVSDEVFYQELHFIQDYATEHDAEIVCIFTIQKKKGDILSAYGFRIQPLRVNAGVWLKK